MVIARYSGLTAASRFRLIVVMVAVTTTADGRIADADHCVVK